MFEPNVYLSARHVTWSVPNFPLVHYYFMPSIVLDFRERMTSFCLHGAYGLGRETDTKEEMAQITTYLL